ncbi:hypothetical protein DXG01_006306 [Tephrocybe rancida]|nr:hypothetical protein DXG01_006306 [Tephrocybe rancida]
MGPTQNGGSDVTRCWNTMDSDIIGNVQCDGLAGQRTATKNGGMPAQAFCYEMKVIEAFSWMLCSLNIIALIILFRLVTLAQMYGRPDIWWEPIRGKLGAPASLLAFLNNSNAELPWFGETPGFYNTHQGQMMQYPGGYPYGQQPMSAMSTHHAGQTIVIQPGMNGQPSTVTTVPMA